MFKSKINRMYILSFLFSLHIALSAYANSTFLTKIISERYVGLLYTVASILTIILLSRSSSILRWVGNRTFVISSLLINMVSLSGMIASNNPYIIATSFILFLATNSLIFLSLDIFIEHFEDPTKIGRTRGLYLTIINIAWMMSPLITSYLITKEGGYRSIYILSFIATFIMTVGLLFSVRTFKDTVYKKTPFLETYKFLKTNPHMLSINMINFILQFFYVWMVIYVPIYLLKHIGLGWEQMGIIFTIMLAPFILISLPIGVLIDKYRVKKRLLLYIGFLIMGLATFSITTIESKSILIWAVVLFFTRVGASMIESTSEIYFFTHKKEEDSSLLSIFRDMTPVAYIIAPLFSTMIFMFLPFKSLFIILSIIILLSGLYYIPRLKHNHENPLSN